MDKTEATNVVVSAAERLEQQLALLGAEERRVRERIIEDIRAAYKPGRIFSDQG